MPRWNADLDAFWLHPMAEIRLDAILAPTRLKVYGTKLVDALHPVHVKFDIDANRLHIYMCFCHGNAG